MTNKYKVKIRAKERRNVEAKRNMETSVGCHQHKLASVQIICVHLFNGESNEWIPVLNHEEDTEDDWICPKCGNIS